MQQFHPLYNIYTIQPKKPLRVINLGRGQYDDDWLYASCPEPARGSRLYLLHLSHGEGLRCGSPAIRRGR